MRYSTRRLLALGDSAWTLEFGSTVDPLVNAQVMALASRVTHARSQEALFAAVMDVVPTFRSLTVHFSPQSTDADALAERLLELAQDEIRQMIEGRHWHLPACFDPSFAPDLPALAHAKGMTENRVIEYLLATQFQVYMIGFLPGFPYMGGLPPELEMPRLASPRPRVPAHSIAITGQTCAVYPWESPGGWNLVGRTPVQLFDLQHSDQPAMLAAGDTVSWYYIDTAEYETLRTQYQSGLLQREIFLRQEGGT